MSQWCPTIATFFSQFSKVEHETRIEKLDKLFKNARGKEEGEKKE
jgi:hypothetical protein